MGLGFRSSAWNVFMINFSPESVMPVVGPLSSLALVLSFLAGLILAQQTF